ncbi:tetratricopeptide repeat protein, partial [Anabaena cylindrica UHCC 0172]|uniref:tetratricopeptide repeat protein n=1 Tax=Anabaena cylindrica TaxID=1165 RepID=UPI002B220BCA
MRRDALVVGINKYPFLKDSKTGKYNHLTTPADDAEVIAQLLEADDNFRVQRLPKLELDGKIQVDPNGRVSCEELSQEINKLFCADNNRDTALLFFAGHGLQQLNSLGNKKKILLATSDTKGTGENSILLNDLWELLEESPVKEQIIWLDSCYSGKLLEFQDSDLPRRISGLRRFIIAASHSSEVAYERFDGKHGVLSGALIEGLASDQIDHHSWITARTLGAFVDIELKKYYAETKIPQLPQIRIPDQEIRLIKGRDQSTTHQQSDTNQSLERKVPFVLPQLDVSTFTGRDDELKQLEDLLLKPQGTKFCSIAGLAGIGGIGKSALACHFATIHKADFPDGVIGLRVDGKDIDTIAREFARRFGEEIDPEDERDAATIMQEVFAHRRMLLIFDNADDASIRQLRPGGNRCAVIVTTRDRSLAIALEIPSEGRINLPLLPETDALLLLEKLIGRERVQAEPEAAHQLIELVGYLPIAIKIIGSQLSLDERRSLARHAKRLTQEKQLARIKFGDSEHLNLFICFSISLEYLQPDEIDFFACLSVCAKNGFSISTTMVVTACNEYATEDYLSKLYRLSLINYSEVEKDRFVFHPLIHQFATEKAIELGFQEEAAARHGEYFIQFINREINHAVAKEIAAELDEIILAAQWLQQQKITSKFQETDKYNFAVCLQPFFEQYGYWEQAVDFMLGFEKLAESNEDWEKVIKFRIQQAKYLSLQGKLTSAEKLLEAKPILDILKKIEEGSTRQRSKAKWLNTLGSNILMRQGKFDQAVEVFQRAINIDEQINNQEGLGISLNCLGGALQRQGKLNEAKKVLNRNYNISIELKDKHHEAMVLHNLGTLFLEQNRLHEAFNNLQRSYEIFKELGYNRRLRTILNSLAKLYQKQGKIEEAIQSCKQAIAIAQEIDNKQQLAISITQLAGLYQKQGRIEEAVQSCKQAIAIAQEIDNKQ